MHGYNIVLQITAIFVSVLYTGRTYTETHASFPFYTSSFNYPFKKCSKKLRYLIFPSSCYFSLLIHCYQNFVLNFFLCYKCSTFI